MPRLRIGSRGSQLALWQANHIAARLAARGVETEIEIIRTTGDRVTEVALSQVGAKGMFTKEIEDALAEGRVQLAVHSLKDLPTDLEPGFELAAITERESPFDVLLSARYDSLAALPAGARVGTSSLRRQAQLRALRPDLELLPVRGNVDTRLRKLEAGEYDALVLAGAGVRRLGLVQHLRQIFNVQSLCPAAGQGALAIEIRAGDQDTAGLLGFLDHAPTRAAVLCERALLRALGGGCQVPIGAFAEGRGQMLHLTAIVAPPDGSHILRESRTGSSTDPEALGAAAAQALLRAGARQILDAVYGSAAAAPQQP